MESPFGRSKHRAWSCREEKALREGWAAGRPAVEIAEDLGRSVHSVRERATVMGLRREPGWRETGGGRSRVSRRAASQPTRRKVFTARDAGMNERDFLWLRLNYGAISAELCGLRLGMDAREVTRIARLAGLEDAAEKEAEPSVNKKHKDMIYGYLRVSSDEQDVNSQKQGVEQFAKDKGWTIDKYITDEGVSGGKDPDKRNLGPLLKLVNKGDVIICSEISRLGRDLYMVMDILHFCMERGCIIHTVKDRFTLGDDIQSKVLAFAFGLSAEIERQMIRQRTKEGLRLRVKQGILLGRPPMTISNTPITYLSGKKEQVIEQFNWGVPERRLAQNFGVDRNTVARWLHRWGVKRSKWIERLEKEENARPTTYKDGNFEVIEDIDRAKLRRLIECDLTIPQISEQFGGYTYGQIYDTIYCDRELNPLYRKHGQLKIKKRK